MITIIIIDRSITGPGKIENMNDCICPGEEVTFQCTVCGEGATAWTGSLLECAGNEITLRHSQFELESGSIGECNNGAIVARSIGVTDTNGSHCYVSQLSFITSSDHNNKTIVCQNVTSTNITFVSEIVVIFVTGKEFCTLS